MCKNIAKEIKISWDGCYPYCPVCGSRNVSKNGDGRRGEHWPFCPDCGQKLEEFTRSKNERPDEAEAEVAVNNQNFRTERISRERLTQYNEESGEIDFLINNVSERGSFNILDLAKHRESNTDFDDFLLEVAQKLKDYEDLEEQGLLLKLPCKAGTHIWTNDFGKTCCYKVTGFSLGNLNEDCCKNETNIFDQVLVYYTNSNKSITGNFAASEIGKSVFLTLAEAEEALKKKIPKKPVKRSFIIPHEGIDVCPNCKNPISKKEHICNCGQAIDWSDNDE